MQQITADHIREVITANCSAPYIDIREAEVWGKPVMHIIFAASYHELHQVREQRPQQVSLILYPKTLELRVSNFGGMGGQHIYKKPDRSHPREKYLAMAGVKIPFRKPKPVLDSVIRAIGKFANNWQSALRYEYQKDNLMYNDVVNYSFLKSDCHV